MPLENISRREFLKGLGGLVLFNSIPQFAQTLTSSISKPVETAESSYSIIKVGS